MLIKVVLLLAFFIISAVVFIGYACQFGQRFGMAAIWIGLGNAYNGSLMAWLKHGQRTPIMTNHLKSATMPEFFGSRYMSPVLRVGASIIVFIFLIPCTANISIGRSFPTIPQSPINSGALTMLAGLIIVPLVSAYTKAPGKTLVESYFSCYQETVNMKVHQGLWEGGQ